MKELYVRDIVAVNYLSALRLGILLSALDTQLGEMQGIGLSNNLNPVSMLPKGLS